MHFTRAGFAFPCTVCGRKAHPRPFLAAPRDTDKSSWRFEFMDISGMLMANNEGVCSERPCGHQASPAPPARRPSRSPRAGKTRTRPRPRQEQRPGGKRRPQTGVSSYLRDRAFAVIRSPRVRLEVAPGRRL